MSNCRDSTRGLEWKVADAIAYQQNAGAFRSGITTDEAIEYYSQYCHQYEESLRPGRYNGPRIAADAVARYYPRDREQKKIIDIAAGTGFVAENLTAHGFRHIDALEPSTSMLVRAKEKSLYETLYENMLTEEHLPIAADTYDCAVVCGGFGEGHIPCSGLKELLRITKPGGVICNVMREEYLVNVEEYRECLEPLMNSLEKAGKWTLVSRDVVPNYFIDLPGIVFMYKVN
ncbi:methyltransferase-like protein 27 [Haliotis rufescens]|uniref:methyltransferase-like protein 27 n=1 Tax=Haliotis rufescens TaxID=6454 RepID=UPI001EB02DBE|nr:methyltransferase-like protein 27 [Haliotis rufescens]